MKNTIKLVGMVMITGLLLAGCYVLVDDGVGSVGIELPDTNNAGGPSDQEIARIYLLNETSLVEIGDTTPYKVVDITTVENEVSIGPVPSGPGYQVILVLGNPDSVTGVFVPGLYAVSEPFAVFAGQATPVDLVSVASQFGYVAGVLGENLVGITFVDGSFYTASADNTGSDAFRLSPALAVTATAALPAGETANGLGVGALIGEANPVPWINTNKGILPWLGNSTFSDTPKELGFDVDYPAGFVFPSVLDSGAFISGADLYGWFQVDGGLGGVYDEFLSAGDKQWLTDIDLSTFISGEPVSDLAVDFSTGSVEGYFASKLGAFKLPEVVLTDPELDTVPEILDAATFFEVMVDEEEAAITELALVGTDLYLGTNRGVVSVATADLILDSIPTSTVVTESLGRTVRDMAMGSSYHAILTDHFLIVSSNGGSTYSVVPIYAGIVTAPTGLFLDDVTGVVLIAGETGISTVDIDDL